MLGWEVFVYRRPIKEGSRGSLVARWMTSPGGLKWIDDLVKDNKAVDLGGDGYPLSYTAKASVLIPILKKGLPSHDSPPVIGDDYILPKGWSGKLALSAGKISALPADEELLIEAWDQS